MIATFTREIRPALTLLALMTVGTGVLYPLAVTGAAQVAFHDKANGSLIVREGKTVGSELIAQPFTSARYFWPRPSAASYNGGASSGSNFGPTSPALATAITSATLALKSADPGNGAPIPVDLATMSGSGLDPHISPEAARWQAPRVARERGIPLQKVEEAIAAAIEGRDLGFLGEPRVNVLKLNLALDGPGM